MKEMNNTFENPNVTYSPSGLHGSETLNTGVMYGLFILVGAVLMQAPIAVASGLASALIVLGGGTAMQMIFCYVGLAACYFYLGRLFSLILRPCTKLVHCRNPKFEDNAIKVMIFLTVGIRVAFSIVMLDYMNDWAGTDAELNWIAGVEWGLMILLFFAGSWAMGAPMPPYCEKCRKYMKKEIFKTSSSETIMPETLGVLHQLCVADEGLHFEESNKIHCSTYLGDEFLAINLETCPDCYDGFVTAVQHKKVIGEDKKKHKVQTVAYANCLMGKQTFKLRGLLVFIA